jgi:hypothetical protein
MRYFAITFVRRPNGQIDESTQTLNKLRNRDLTDCNVILDFKDETIIKCRMTEGNIPVDWNTVVGYYSKHYGDTFAQLVRANADLEKG